MMERLYVGRSKVRRELLTLFFSNTDRNFYLRELERFLGYSAGNIRRELLKLQSDQIFRTQRMGNLVYYSLNKNHPLYQELKSIVFKTTGIQASLKASLTSLRHIKTAFIFGSFASKSEKETSDIDVMIIGKPDISVLNEKVRDLENRLKREISVSVYAPEEYQAKKESKSGFVMEILKKPIIMLIGSADDL